MPLRIFLFAFAILSINSIVAFIPSTLRIPFPKTTTSRLYAIDAVTVCKDELLSLLSMVPSGLPTPKGMTTNILQLVEHLEYKCPTPDQDVLAALQGSWELIWTAQDTKAPEANLGLRSLIINPFENQNYSNNPQGRSNPFLPVSIQNQLEALGLVSATPVRSTQAIDGRRRIIRNTVTLNLGPNRHRRKPNKNDDNKNTNYANDSLRRMMKAFSSSIFNPMNNPLLSLPSRALMSVTIGFEPVSYDPRRVDVKFQSFRFSIPGTPIEMDMPLGTKGPTGWLRTVYVDDDLRISRGHKGSVFVLSRPRGTTV